MAQLAEQLICNQQVIGSSPIIGFMDGFPSGQRGQTVNLLQIASVVRIHLHPFDLLRKSNVRCTQVSSKLGACVSLHNKRCNVFSFALKDLPLANQNIKEVFLWIY